MFMQPRDLADDSRSACSFLKALCAPAPSSPPSLKYGHTKGKLSAQSPREPADASLSCYLQNVLFSCGAEDAKITFHLCALERGWYECFIVLMHVKSSRGPRRKADALVMTSWLFGKL